MLFARSGWTGQQAVGLTWAGDQASDFWSLRVLVVATLSAACSGFSNWSHDVGGYLGHRLVERCPPELLVRWLQFGCFTPLMHAHGRMPQEPWHYSERVLELYRAYVLLHEQLVPYVRAAADTAARTGLPIIRPLCLTDPTDPRGWAIGDAYGYGPALWVAPVLDDEAREREVALPRGDWIETWSGSHVAGGGEVVVEAPLERIPVWVRAGSIVVTYPAAHVARGLGDVLMREAAAGGDAVGAAAARAGGRPAGRRDADRVAARPVVGRVRVRLRVGAGRQLPRSRPLSGSDEDRRVSGAAHGAPTRVRARAPASAPSCRGVGDRVAPPQPERERGRKRIPAAVGVAGRTRKRRGLPAALGLAPPAPAAVALGSDQQPSVRRDPGRPGALVLVALAEHQRVHRCAVGLEHRSGPRRGDDERRGVRSLQGAVVAGGEVHAAGVAQTFPLELVRAARLEAVAERDDRPLAARLEERHRPAGRLVAPGDVHADAARLELRHGRLAFGVTAERAVEVDLGAELGQDRRGDPAAPSGARERVLGVEDLAAHREMRHHREVDPFDVTDYPDRCHAV